MFGKSATFAVALAILAASGCATFPGRDPALDDARLSLDAARRNPQVAMYASAELDQAAATLRQAEDLAANGGRYNDAHQLAVLANQRAAAAQDVARHLLHPRVEVEDPPWRVAPEGEQVVLDRAAQRVRKEAVHDQDVARCR